VCVCVCVCVWECKRVSVCGNVSVGRVSCGVCVETCVGVSVSVCECMSVRVCECASA
jgi:hypothetical protein